MQPFIPFRTKLRPGALLLSLAAALVGLALTVGTAEARSPKDVVGHWNGFINVDDHNVPVQLDIEALKAGRSAAALKWGSPENCEMHAVYSGQDEGHAVLAIAKTDADWCNLYRSGKARVALEGRFLSIQLADAKDGRTLTGMLDPGRH